MVHSEVDVDVSVFLGFQSQIIDFKSAFSQAYIPSGEPVFIEITRYFRSNGGQGDVVLRLKKILYVQAEAKCLWYEKEPIGLISKPDLNKRKMYKMIMQTAEPDS